ncbi:hypothetical protein [Sphingomonas sp. ID0503]|uniref:hypothetical protein n=1 Tax=Sphingomonas sp. ID0503 TaxID=3399691 RepID=UPI003AFA2CEB
MSIDELARSMGVSVGDLADRTVTLDQVLGREAGELGGRLLTSGSTDTQLDVLDTFLAKRLSLAPERDGTMAHIMQRLRCCQSNANRSPQDALGSLSAAA